MTIKWIQETDLLEVEAPEIVDYADDMLAYTGIKLTATETCGTPYTYSYLNAQITNTTNYFWLDPEVKKIYVAPSMVGLTEFRDSVIKLDIRLQMVDGYDLISNCIFVDDTYKCKVAALLQNIIGENGTPEHPEKPSTVAHLLHYALTSGSNCGCNCDEMCEVFKGLTALLTGIDISILNDCGC